MSKGARKASGRRDPRGGALSAEVYERLWRINQAFEEARRCLRELGGQRGATFAEVQVRPYEELVAEAQAAINSFLTGILETRETQLAGQLFRRRQSRERAEGGD